MVKGLTKDTDKDGVADFFDCKPNNPNEQGILHSLKEKYNEHAEASRQKKYAEKQIRKKSRAAYYRESEKAEIKEAERDARMDARRDRSQRTKTVAKTVRKGFEMMPTKKKTPVKKKSTKKKKSKYVVVGGKAYELGGQSAKQRSTKKKTPKKQATKQKSPWDMTLEEMF